MFAFVVLHYNVVEETKKCIESILDLCDVNDYAIVVVDNCSPNGSGKKLKEDFEKDSNVHVILNEKNLGFANGNNVGIHFARNILNADFVVVLNNDTYLVQNNFCKVVLQEWSLSHFAVLGPYVHTFSGKNQNPCPHQITTTKQVDFWINHHRKGLIRAYFGVDSIWLSLKDWVKKMGGYKNEEVRQKEKNNEVRQENVKLHGCCFVFSPEFFVYYDGFDSRTFMYAEEDILLAQIRKKNLKTVYNPKLEIFHAERAATKSATRTTRQKKLFLYSEGIKSLKVLKRVLEE